MHSLSYKRRDSTHSPQPPLHPSRSAASLYAALPCSSVLAALPTLGSIPLRAAAFLPFELAGPLRRPHARENLGAHISPNSHLLKFASAWPEC